MPRIARKSLDTSFFHIMVQGINKEYIFAEKCEMEKYLNLLEKNYEECNIEIIAYCIMNNHAHLLVYTEQKMELTKFMSKVNTSYAIYYNKKHNRCGYVFRNRYNVEPIFTEKHLLSCIKYIHYNPVEAKICKNEGDYQYSSYNDYISKTRFVNEQVLKTCFENIGCDYISAIVNNYNCNNFIENLENICTNPEEIIREFKKQNNVDDESIVKNKSLLRTITLKLYSLCDITQKEIADALGVNRLVIHRIIKK